MSIKTTRDLTRSEALTLYAELHGKLCGEPALSNEELGDLLEIMDEAVCKRECRLCTSNYTVNEVSEDARSILRAAGVSS